MKISLVQMNSISDKPTNIAVATELIEAAIETERPDWIALPEVFSFIGARKPDKLAAAEKLGDGPAYIAMRDLAAKHRVFIHAGSMLETVPDEDRVYSTTVAFDRNGKEVARYRKIHMFDVDAPDGTSYRESAAFRPGDAIATYDCDGVTIGCAVCYDLRFPYFFQALVEKGAEVIALPSAFTLQTGKDHWEVLLRARAIDTQTYVVAAAQVGSHTIGNETRQSYGHSLVVDPWGHVVARASDGPGVVSARIDVARVAHLRQRMPVSRHRVSLPHVRT